MQGDAVLVDLRAGLRVVDNLREHALGSFAYLDRSLPGARSVDSEITDAEGKDRSETFGEIFFAAVEAVNGDHQRHRSFGVFRQAQIADDFFALKRNANHFKRRIEKLSMG